MFPLRKIINAIKRFDNAYIDAMEINFGKWKAIKYALNNDYKRSLALFRNIPCKLGKTIIDVGANRGNFIHLAQLRFAPKKAICIEPLQEAFLKLKQRYNNNPKFSLFNCALGASSGQTEMEVNTHDEASSILPIRTEGELIFTHKDLRPIDKILIELKTVDQIVREENVTSVELLKLDVQGFELEVLKGAMETLPKTRVILSEISFYHQYEKGALFWDIHQFLKEKNFYLIDLGAYQTSKDGALLQGDAVFINKNLI